MAEIYVLDPNPPALVEQIDGIRVPNIANLTELVQHLFKKGNSEKDTNNATVVVLPPTIHGTKSLDQLSGDDAQLLLRYFFNHLNILVVNLRQLTSQGVVRINTALRQISGLIGGRISRVATWTGTGGNINDFFAEKSDDLALEVAHIVSTMSFVVDHNSNKLAASEDKLRGLHVKVVELVDFRSLLADPSDANLARLCHAVGHWSFPAHELTNDDLVYCVVLILTYALDHIAAQGSHPDFAVPSPNQLLAFVFMVRDTYKNGNPFHNFRHAVDVLQACFHYLVRLLCLPQFEQFEVDPRTDETPLITGKAKLSRHTRLVPNKGVSKRTAASGGKLAAEQPPHLNPLQALGLLIAALGHDVGHPGVTNAFLIKHAAPTSQLYSERSVLELYHSLVFLNKILRINWPLLLDLETDPRSKLLLKSLIIGSILATDMAEHFEYIHKLKELEVLTDRWDSRVPLIASLLIKCADISNVTRPLRVSSQWALVLSREFEEVDTLDTKLTKQASVKLDVNYGKLPTSLDDILQASPNLHKGQIFFIDTFAEGLFKSILELLPELKYTCDIVQDNKVFWLARA